MPVLQELAPLAASVRSGQLKADVMEATHEHLLGLCWARQQAEAPAAALHALLTGLDSAQCGSTLLRASVPCALQRLTASAGAALQPEAQLSEQQLLKVIGAPLAATLAASQPVALALRDGEQQGQLLAAHHTSLSSVIGLLVALLGDGAAAAILCSGGEAAGREGGEDILSVALAALSGATEEVIAWGGLPAPVVTGTAWGGEGPRVALQAAHGAARLVLHLLATATSGGQGARAGRGGRGATEGGVSPVAGLPAIKRPAALCAELLHGLLRWLRCGLAWEAESAAGEGHDSRAAVTGLMVRGVTCFCHLPLPHQWLYDIVPSKCGEGWEVPQ